MSHGKKSKRKKHQQKATLEHTEADKNVNKRPPQINITGRVEADLPPYLVEKYDAAGKKEERWNRKIFAAEIVAAILLAASVGAVAWQGFLIRESNRTNRESLTSVQRAFVTVNPVPEIQTANASSNKLMFFNFWMQNAGATRTKKTLAHVNWVKSNNGLPLPPDFNFPDQNSDGSQDSTVSVIGPKDRFPLSVGPIPSDFIERLYRREVRLFVYGWVRYNDIFEKTPRHVVKFSYELVAVPGVVRLQTGQEGQGLQTLVNGPRFNCYDEECDEQAHQ